MRLPPLAHPDRYVGLYIVDFGGSAGVGYTGEEAGMLAASGRYAGVKIYRIRRADPGGTMELQGVAAGRFGGEAAMFFYGRDAEAARGDFARLLQAAAEHPPRCQAELVLGVLPETARLRHVVGLIYPAESDPDVAGWLLERNLSPGECADGGHGNLTAVRRDARILESAQLLPEPWRRPRPPAEVLAAVGQAIQR